MRRYTGLIYIFAQTFITRTYRGPDKFYFSFAFLFIVKCGRVVVQSRPRCRRIRRRIGFSRSKESQTKVVVAPLIADRIGAKMAGGIVRNPLTRAKKRTKATRRQVFRRRSGYPSSARPGRYQVISDYSDTSDDESRALRA